MLLHAEILSIFTKMMVWLLGLKSLGFGKGKWLPPVCELHVCLLRLQVLCICLLAYSLSSAELCPGKPLTRKMVCSQGMCVYRSLQLRTMFMVRNSQVLNSSVPFCSLWSVDTHVRYTYRQKSTGLKAAAPTCFCFLWVRKDWMHVHTWK